MKSTIIPLDLNFLLPGSKTHAQADVTWQVSDACIHSIRTERLQLTTLISDALA